VRLPTKVLEALEQQDVIIVATLPNGRVRVISKLKPGERRAKLLLRAFLLEITKCDETCQVGVVG